MLLSVEDAVLEGLLFRAGVSPWEADSMRRLPPLHRDVFDNFVFSATRVAVGESEWSNFPRACSRYVAAVGGDVHRRPPLIPPDVVETVAQVLSPFQPRQSDEKPAEDLGKPTGKQQELGEQLFYALGGDLGDGWAAAGLRVYSKMLSARISDGFVHPAVGARIWSDVPAGPPHRAESGRLVTILDTIEALYDTWMKSPAERPTVERLIIDRAHTFGWRTRSPGMIAVSPGRWYATPPSQE